MLTNWNDDIDDPTPRDEQPVSPEFVIFALAIIICAAFVAALIGCVTLAVMSGFCR